MKLNRDSKLVRFSYMLYNPIYQGYNSNGRRIYGRVPLCTSLCFFFWQTFAFMPAICLLILGIPCILGYAAWQNPFVAGMALLASVFLIGVGTLTAYTYNRLKDRPTPTLIRVFVAGIKTIKSKVCPIIELD
jgi:hypothetical protein